MLYNSLLDYRMPPIKDNPQNYPLLHHTWQGIQRDERWKQEQPSKAPTWSPEQLAELVLKNTHSPEGLRALMSLILQEILSFILHLHRFPVLIILG